MSRAQGTRTPTAVVAADVAARVRRVRAAPGRAVRGAAIEALWLAAHTWHYPAGVGRVRVRALGFYRQHRTDALPPTERSMLVSDPAEAATPVLLVHGIGDNRSVFALMERALRRRGYGVVHAVNYSVLTPVHGDLRDAAVELGRHVDRLRTRTGSDAVHVIGHSLGGLIARYYVQRLGGDDAVDALVTMGTAHRGSLVAELLPRTTLLRSLRPNSELLTELAAPTTCRTRFLSVWSHADPMMVPRRTARLEHPDLDTDDVELDHVGHVSMTVEPRVLHRVVGWLARQDRRARDRPAA